MESDAHRWDEKYRASTIDALRAEPLLSRHIARIRHLSGSRTALDLAAGRCHASVYLATEGLSVTAVDCSAVGLDLGQALAAQEGVEIKTMVADLETDPLPVGPWSLIACFRYLNRELFEPMKAGLEPGVTFSVPLIAIIWKTHHALIRLMCWRRASWKKPSARLKFWSCRMAMIRQSPPRGWWLDVRSRETCGAVYPAVFFSTQRSPDLSVSFSRMVRLI